MASQFDRALRDLLRAAGCTLIRQGKGSHEIWHSPITRRNFPVPTGTDGSPGRARLFKAEFKLVAR